MFRTLLETRAPRVRDRGSVAASVVVHAGVIAAAIVATATADAHPSPPVRPNSVIWTPPPSTTQPPPQRGGATAPTGAPSPAPTSTPTVSVDVDATLPDFSLPQPVPGTTGSFTPTTTGTPGGSVTGEPGGVWSEHTVEKPVIALGDGARPRYPDLLRSAGVEGDVLAQFVVDTLGRVEPGSLRVLRSAHPLFAQAVERALPQARFIPAEAGGRRVRQLVQQPFTFAIAR